MYDSVTDVHVSAYARARACIVCMTARACARVCVRVCACVRSCVYVHACARVSAHLCGYDNQPQYYVLETCPEDISALFLKTKNHIR